MHVLCNFVSLHPQYYLLRSFSQRKKNKYILLTTDYRAKRMRGAESVLWGVSLIAKAGGRRAGSGKENGRSPPARFFDRPHWPRACRVTRKDTMVVVAWRKILYAKVSFAQQVDVKLKKLLGLCRRTSQTLSDPDSGMAFIPEWVSFQNEVRSAFTWHNRWAQSLSAILTWYQNEIYDHNGTIISFRLKPEWTHSRMTSKEMKFWLGIM